MFIQRYSTPKLAAVISLRPESINTTKSWALQSKLGIKVTESKESTTKEANETQLDDKDPESKFEGENAGQMDPNS